MADFNKGQTFLDIKATNYQGIKPKYFIAMSDANDEDDIVVCFFMNTEHRMEKYNLNCNRASGRFIIATGTFSFIKEPTSIILSKEVHYKYSEMYGSNIKLLDAAKEILLRQIKNCINFDDISVNSAKIIKDCFKHK